jgi:hypothetical protein
MARISWNAAAVLTGIPRTSFQNLVHQHLSPLTSDGKIETDDLIRLGYLTRDILEGTMEDVPKPITTRHLALRLDALAGLLEPQARLTQEMLARLEHLTQTVQTLVDT